MITRRRLLSRAGALGLAISMPRLAFAQSKTLVAATFPGTWSEADRNVILPAFKTKTGATATQSKLASSVA